MKNNKKGFTLVELLVVVLIIGVLAAIALPMYQKAVKRSRFSALMPIAKALNEGNEHYYLNHNVYSTDPAELDIAGKDEYDDDTEVYLVDEDGLSYVMAYNEDRLPDNKYIAFQKHSDNFAETTICEAADDAAGQICESFGGTLLEDGSLTKGWRAYLLSGDATGSSFPSLGTCPGGASVGTEAAGSGSVCTKVCAGGVCEYKWTGGSTYTKQFSQCKTDEAYGCSGSTFSGADTSCVADHEGGCSGTTYNEARSSCVGRAEGTCSNSTFVESANGSSTCYGYRPGACLNSTFIAEGYTSSYTHCEAAYPEACSGSTFGPGTYCLSNTGSGGCGNVTYEEGSWCEPSQWGKCAAGTPAGSKSWNNGPYVGQCWDGNGNRGAQYCTQS